VTAPHRYIHQDDTGVAFDVTYSIDGGDILFEAVHVLGADYLPCGPNLVDFLHSLVVLDGSTPPNGVRYLATILEDLPPP
jgi:hypothetical protein